MQCRHLRLEILLTFSKGFGFFWGSFSHKNVSYQKNIYLSFWILWLEILALSTNTDLQILRISFACKHNGVIFYHHRNNFNFVSNIFFSPLYIWITYLRGKLTEETFDGYSLMCSIMPCFSLTLSWRRPLSYGNQSIDLLRKSMDWFRYDKTACIMKELTISDLYIIS